MYEKIQYKLKKKKKKEKKAIKKKKRLWPEQICLINLMRSDG